MRDLAQPALFETVVLDTPQAMQGFAELLRGGSGEYLGGCVRNLSPWKDDFGDGGQQGRQCAADIISRCPNLLNIQTRGSVLGFLRNSEPPKFEEAFVWLEHLLFPAHIFAHTTRLHVADLQRLVSQFPQLLFSALSAENIPRLKYFSSTWASYQMFEEDHDALGDFARTMLALPTLTRFVVRVVGMVYDLPTLVALKDARVLVAPFDERDEVQSNNLTVWAHNALRMGSMWTGRPIYREHAVIIAPSRDRQLDNINEE
ncbi:hypothetical protein AURDEDRAFT_168064 [Auricularia subglabra TFB-10046 SS5]|nr:hypothetical protein AURDEDRAFT_168064 [Auricularia subglabra TFB-10046 SS5]